MSNLSETDTVTPINQKSADKLTVIDGEEEDNQTRRNKTSALDIVRNRVKTDSDPGDTEEQDLVKSDASTTSGTKPSGPILKFKCREYLIHDERAALEASLNEGKTRQKPEEKLKVRFTETIEIAFFPKEEYFVRHERGKEFFLVRGYLLLDLKSLYVMELDTSSEVFVDRDAAFNFWCTRIREGIRLESFSNINGELNYSNLRKRLPLGIVPIPRTMSISELSISDGPHAYKDWAAKRELPLEGITKLKLSSDLTAFDRKVTSLLETLMFHKSSQAGSILEVENKKLVELRSLNLIIKENVLQENNFLFPFMTRCLALRDIVAKLRNKSVKKLLKKIPGIELLSSSAPERCFFKAKIVYEKVFAFFDLVGKLIEGVEQLSNRFQNHLALSRFHMTSILKERYFAKVLVETGVNKYQCLFTQSLFVREEVEGKEIYVVEHIKNISESNRKFHPKEGEPIREPKILDKYYSDLPVIFQSLTKYWVNVKISILEEFMAFYNGAMITAIVNNNMRLVDVLEKIRVNKALQDISCLAAERPIRSLVHDTVSISHVLRVFKRNRKNKALHVSSLSLVLNPVMRADLCYSRYHGFTSNPNNPGHSGKLLSVVIVLGHIEMARYMISRGVSLRKKFGGPTTQYMYWDFLKVKRKLSNKLNNDSPESRTKQSKTKKKPKVKKNGKRMRKSDILNLTEKRIEAKGQSETSRSDIGNLTGFDPIHMRIDRRIKLVSICELSDIPSHSVYSVMSCLTVKQRNFSADEASAIISERRLRYEFAMDILASKKTKVLKNKGSIIRATLPCILQIYRALMKVSAEKQAALSFALLEASAMKSYKDSLRTENYKKQVKQYEALICLKLLNTIIAKAMKELKSPRKYKVITLLLIDECIKQDQFDILPRLCTDVALAKMALKVLSKGFSQPVSTHKRILKGFYVMCHLFPTALDISIVSKFFAPDNLLKLFWMNCFSNAGEDIYVRKILTIQSVKTYISNLAIRELCLVYSTLGIQDVNNQWVTRKLNDEDRSNVEYSYLRLMVLKKDHFLSSGQLEEVQDEIITKVLRSLLDPKVMSMSLVQAVYNILTNNHKYLEGCDVDITVNFFIMLLCNGAAMVNFEIGDAMADLTYLKLCRLFARVIFLDNIYQMEVCGLVSTFLQIVCTLLEDETGNYLEFVVLDFIETVCKVGNLKVGIKDDSPLVRLISQCCLNCSMTVKWNRDDSELKTIFYEECLSADYFIQELYPA